MSGRNNRIVRNRDRSSQFSWNVGMLKVVAGVAISVLLLAVVLFAVFRPKEEKKTICLAEGPNVAYEYFLLSSGENVGVIDKQGNIVIEAKYSQIDIPNPSKPVFICYADDKTTVLGEKGEPIFTDREVQVVKISREEDEQIEKLVLKYQKDGLYGLLNFEGKEITEPIYDEISTLKDKPGSILVKKENKYGILDSYGNTILDLKYDSILADGYCSENDSYEKAGYIISQKTNDGVNFGYVNRYGELVLDIKYESIERALEYEDDTPYLIAMQKGKKGVFKNKKEIIDLNYQDIHYSELSKVFIVNKNGKFGFYQIDGKAILKPEYTSYSIAGNYISVEKDGEKKLFDINGNLVNTHAYTQMIETKNPAYFIAQDESGYYSIISKDVNIDKKYQQVSYAFDDFFIVTDEEGKSGVINAAKNSVEIEPQYDFVIFMDDTKFLQAIDGMNNLIEIYSSNLEKTITMEDAIVDHLENGYSIVYSGSDMKYINSNGEIVENTEVYPEEKLYATKQNEKWGYVDATGKIVIPCEYDIVTEFNEYGFSGIKKDGKWGVANENGEIIVEPMYELDTYYFPQFIGKYVLNKSESIYCEEIM